MKSRDRDLLPVLFDNTAIKIWLTPISPDDIDALQSLSNDELKTRGSTKGFRSGVSSVSMHEVYEPQLEANDIRDAGFTGDQGFLILNSFQGHVEPTRFRFAFDVSRDEYDRLATTPLPKREKPRGGGAPAPLTPTAAAGRRGLTNSWSKNGGNLIGKKFYDSDSYERMRSDLPALRGSDHARNLPACKEHRIRRFKEELYEQGR